MGEYTKEILLGSLTYGNVDGWRIRCTPHAVWNVILAPKCFLLSTNHLLHARPLGPEGHRMHTCYLIRCHLRLRTVILKVQLSSLFGIFPSLLKSSLVLPPLALFPFGPHFQHVVFCFYIFLHFNRFIRLRLDGFGNYSKLSTTFGQRWTNLGVGCFYTVGMLGFLDWIWSASMYLLHEKLLL